MKLVHRSAPLSVHTMCLSDHRVSSDAGVQLYGTLPPSSSAYPHLQNWEEGLEPVELQLKALRDSSQATAHVHSCLLKGRNLGDASAPPGASLGPTSLIIRYLYVYCL